jgi:hypothetical protein
MRLTNDRGRPVSLWRWFIGEPGSGKLILHGVVLLMVVLLVVSIVRLAT